MMNQSKLLPAIVLSFATCVTGFSQASVAAGTNNPFSPSPTQRERSSSERSNVPSIRIEASLSGSGAGQAEVIATVTESGPISTGDSLSKDKSDPTKSYNIGAGDQLKIEILGSSVKGEYFVTDDGTIDFPLAGGTIFVAGRSAAAVSQLLKENTKLYSAPEISVTVQKHLSHRVMVTGAVSFPGEHVLVRDALPMYVLRSMAVADTLAVTATVRRISNEGIQVMNVTLDNMPDFLVLPGDQIEFATSQDPSSRGYYYTVGEINAAGKHVLIEGMTLSAAITASGGVHGKAKRARLSTRDANGNAVSTDIDLKVLKSGKVSDPAIGQGNIIEILD